MYGKHNMQLPGDILEQLESISILISVNNRKLYKAYLKADFKKKQIIFFVW